MKDWQATVTTYGLGEDEGIALCPRHAAIYQDTLGPVHVGPHDGVCHECWREEIAERETLI